MFSLEYESEPKLNKKGRESGEPCPYESIGKINVVSGLLGISYGNAVNNQLGREDKSMTFNPQEHKWFRYIEGSRVIGTNKNKPMER